MADGTTRTFDAARSLEIDRILIKLDAGATGLRRYWLLICKRWYERSIPGAHGREVAL